MRWVNCYSEGPGKAKQIFFRFCRLRPGCDFVFRRRSRSFRFPNPHFNEFGPERITILRHSFWWPSRESPSRKRVPPPPVSIRFITEYFLPPRWVTTATFFFFPFRHKVPLTEMSRAESPPTTATVFSISHQSSTFLGD